MTDLIENDAQWNARMDAIDAEANAMELADDEQELSQELADLDNQRTQEEEAAIVDEELANLEAALAEDNKEEEEEESLEAQLAELNNEQEITDADADKAWVELERVGSGNQEEYFQFPMDDSDSGETQDPDLADAFVVPADAAAAAAAAAVPAAAEKKGWFHKTTGFSTNRIPGWQRMRKWTGLGGRTRRRRRNTHKKRSRRRKRHTRKKRKTRKPRRKRKTRKTRRKRRRR